MAKRKKEAEFEGLDLSDMGGVMLDDIRPKYFVDTGNLAINYICSGRFIGGGIPGGKITEVYGPPAGSKSLLTMCILHGCQQMDGIAIALDLERAINRDFAVAAARIDPKRLHVFEPDTIEETFLKITNVIKRVREHYGPDKPIVFMYDSLTAVPCERELRENDLPDGDVSDAQWKKIVGAHEQPGERAKAIGKGLRKLNGLLSNQNATLVVINQVREKIGVLFGCFHYNTRIILSDGSSMKIGKIVNQKLPLEVLSYNTKTGVIEPKKIIDWHKNGSLNDDEFFLQFRVRKRRDNGQTSFACTPNHKIFKVIDGDITEVDAGLLQVGDEILTIQPNYLNNDMKQLVYGSILGDGEIRCGKLSDSCSKLRVGHGNDQKEYCQWKQEIFEPYIGYCRNTEKVYAWDSISMHELTCLRYKHDYMIPEEVIEKIDVLGLAIWYMDDGSFGGSYQKWGKGKSVIYCMKFKNRERMLARFNDWGMNPTLKNKGFYFNSQDTYKLHKLIARYVHPSMNYKIHPDFRHMFDFEISENDMIYKTCSSEILDIYEKPATCTKVKFDLTIADNSTYIADGAVVHNSPETVPGGKSLEFYASCRLRVAPQKQMMKKLTEKHQIPIGVNIQLKNKKNRSFSPHWETDNIQLYFESGINPLGGLLGVFIKAERVKASSAGRYEVLEPWAGGKEVKFQASQERNDVPVDILFECPALVDAKDQQEVKNYLSAFGGAIDLSNLESITEEEIEDENKDLMAAIGSVDE